MRYQRIEVNTWNDEKFVRLSQEAKYMFLYFLTCPHSNSIGAYVVKKGYISDDLQWSAKKVSDGISELSKAGLLKYDEQLSVVVIVNYLRHNVIENPNQCKNAVKNFYSLPKTEILQDVSNRLETVSKHFNIPFESLNQSVSKPEYIYVSVSVSDSDKEGECEGKPEKLKNIIPPKIEWVRKYCLDRENGIDPGEFMDHYRANGWKVGKAAIRMKDWEAAIRTWENRRKEGGINGAGHRPGDTGSQRKADTKAPGIRNNAGQQDGTSGGGYRIDHVFGKRADAAAR